MNTNTLGGLKKKKKLSQANALEESIARDYFSFFFYPFQIDKKKNRLSVKKKKVLRKFHREM